LLANAVSPYSTESNRFNYEESLELVDNLFNKEGFVDANSLVYHGGPSDEEDESRFEVFEEVAHLLQSNENNVDIYMPEDQLHRAKESDTIHASSVNTFDPEKTKDYIEMSVGGNYEGDTIAVTSDYHMERADSLYNQMTSGDYLVLGADSSNHRVASVDVEIGPISFNAPINQTIADLNEFKNLKL